MHGVIGDFNQSSVTKRLAPGRIVRRLALILGALTITSGALWYGESWWTTARFMESTDDAYVGGNVTPISPHIIGFIAEVAVTDNQRVEAGQLLIRLDDRDMRAAADHAKAILDQRTAALSTLRAQYGTHPGSPQAGHAAAIKALWQLAYREASTLAYADAFRLIMIVLMIATLLVPLMRKVVPTGTASSQAHENPIPRRHR